MRSIESWIVKVCSTGNVIWGACGNDETIEERSQARSRRDLRLVHENWSSYIWGGVNKAAWDEVNVMCSMDLRASRRTVVGGVVRVLRKGRLELGNGFS